MSEMHAFIKPEDIMKIIFMLILMCLPVCALGEDSLLQYKLEQAKKEINDLKKENQYLREMLAPKKGGTVCYPPAWGGIVPNYTLDKDVVALYGPGVFSNRLGHGGGRYYTDKDKTATLIIEIGVDNVIETVTLMSGLHFPEGAKPYVSSRFDPKEGFGNYHQLQLGSTKEELISNLGKPFKHSYQVEKLDELVYQTDYANGDCYIDAEISFKIKEGKIYSVIFYNGE